MIYKRVFLARVDLCLQSYTSAIITDRTESGPYMFFFEVHVDLSLLLPPGNQLQCSILKVPILEMNQVRENVAILSNAHPSSPRPSYQVNTGSP